MWLLFVTFVSVIMEYRQFVIAFNTSDFVCWTGRGSQAWVMWRAQFRLMMQSVVNIGRSRIVGPGVSATNHHVLMCHPCKHLHQLLIDGYHTMSLCNVSYWVIPLLLYVVSLVDDWHWPGGVLSGQTWLEYVC